MTEWNGKLSRIQAIEIISSITDQDDPYWENHVEDYYDEDSDTMPSIYHVFAALGVTEQEYKDATGADNVNWPSLTHNAELTGRGQDSSGGFEQHETG